MNDLEIINHIKYSLFDMAYNDILRASKGGSKMGAFILSSCFLDYLAGFRYGKESKREDYKNFIKEYLPQYNPEKLYHDLRCGLIHNYSEGGSYTFTDNRQDLHLRLASTNQLFLNLENFVSDIEVAMNKYFEELSLNSDIIRLAINRFNSKGIIGIGVVNLKQVCNPPLNRTAIKITNLI